MLMSCYHHPSTSIEIGDAMSTVKPLGIRNGAEWTELIGLLDQLELYSEALAAADRTLMETELTPELPHYESQRSFWFGVECDIRGLDLAVAEATSRRAGELVEQLAAR